MSGTLWRSAARVAAIVLLLGAAAFVYLHGQRVRIEPPGEAPAATPLALRDPEGRLIELAELRGKVVVLNAWAAWCGPCRAELPGFNRVYEAYRERGVEILGLNVEGISAGELAEQREALGIRYPVVQPAGALDGVFNEPAMIPHTWFVDRDGRVRGSHSGYVAEGSLRRAVERLLAD